MSDLRHTTSVAPRVSLVLHTAVDFVHKQGIGIGIIQRAPTGAGRNNNMSMEQRKYSVKRNQFTAENVKTKERAHMFAMLHAMGLARGTIKRWRTKTLRIEKVTVLCGSSAVVDLVNFHRDHGPESLEKMTSANDRAMVKRVLAGLRQLLRRGVEVAIAEDGQESSSKETMKTKTMARQKGTTACRSRRQAQRMTLIEPETVDDQTEIEMA